MHLKVLEQCLEVRATTKVARIIIHKVLRTVRIHIAGGSQAGLREERGFDTSDVTS